MRLLAWDRIEQDAVVPWQAAGSHELVSMRIPLERRRCPTVLVAEVDLRKPLASQESRPDEHQGAHERRHGVPGKPEDKRRSSHTEGQRLPRFHGHPPEHLLDAEIGGDPTNEIVRTHRDAARGHENVRS